jgi:hypothetical protein
LKGYGFKANYFDIETGDQFWISGPRRDGADGLYGRVTQPEDLDADVADSYWRDIRGFANAPVPKGGSVEAQDAFRGDAPRKGGQKLPSSGRKAVRLASSSRTKSECA